ncbi:LacI family DNA-binding transcriptional regulator [Saccharibacillus sacchari]|uniref:LacI family DNA-binding transcriptional regulator n=1 Tax=Saccharibacillus sacchari TaxID=456493 RepID=A0ACC6PHA1_9BACL
MAKEKVTIQQIADALGISRNTASKALNDTEGIPEETRARVIKKAIELKYKQFAYLETDGLLPKKTGNIALLTTNMPNTSHFGSQLISGLERRISTEGYNLSIHIVRDDERGEQALPVNFDAAGVDGIVCIELFDPAYSRLLTELGIPVIFIDCAADAFYPDFGADILLMENEHSTYAMTRDLLADGLNEIGFVGDYNHCKSFRERWIGCGRALTDAGLSLSREQSVLDEDRFFIFETDWMERRLGSIERLPQAFVCANDFIAVRLMRALKNIGLSIPGDIRVCGFDDSSESRIVEPHLTTVHIYSSDMGVKAGDMLLSRIRNPRQPYQVTHVYTKPIARESTQGGRMGRQA